MKTITISAFIVMVFFSIAAMPAPEKKASTKNANKCFDGFSSVRSHRQGKGADVSWSFVSSNASGFTVQRTNEDPNDPYSVWIVVSSVGYNSSRSYKCHDENPFPGFINYRIIAVMTDGSTMTSQISTVHITSH
jgi:hypothetical protein